MQYVDVILDVKNNQSQIIWELFERMRPDRSSAMREYLEKALHVTSGHTEEDKDIFQAKYLPRFEYAVWLNEQLQNFRTENVEEAKQSRNRPRWPAAHSGTRLVFLAQWRWGQRQPEL
jgi:hypothetical protein